VQNEKTRELARETTQRLMSKEYRVIRCGEEKDLKEGEHGEREPWPLPAPLAA